MALTTTMSRADTTRQNQPGFHRVGSIVLSGVTQFVPRAPYRPEICESADVAPEEQEPSPRDGMSRWALTEEVDQRPDPKPQERTQGLS